MVVSFPLDSEPGTALLAWTTTPWTLPSNLALAVNPDLVYVKVKGPPSLPRPCDDGGDDAGGADEASGAKYILMQCRLPMLDKAKVAYTVEAEMSGKSLEGLTYQPLLPYFADRSPLPIPRSSRQAEPMGWDGMTEAKGAFRVLCDGYVTTESGTGIVHQAPYFGEDDYRVCLSYGVIGRDEANIVCPVDAAGRFTDPVADFKGIHVKVPCRPPFLGVGVGVSKGELKEADKGITAKLKAEGRLIYQGQFNHSYPFCWRSDTPLIYKAVPCWFIRVEAIRQSLIANNKETYWHHPSPSTLQSCLPMK